MTRPRIAAALAAGLSVIATTPAEAHAFLRDAAPPVGGTVARAPTAVVIDFTEDVEPLFSTIAVFDRSGARVDTGRPHLDGGGARLAVSLRPLGPGVYTVRWHATATDTHRTEGRFTFTVGG